LHIKTKTVSCHRADSKPAKQEVNGTVILPPYVFPGTTISCSLGRYYGPISQYIFLWHYVCLCKHYL